MPVTLCTDPVRPLTNREISKFICAMLNGIAVIEPAVAVEFPEVLELGMRMLEPEHDGGDVLRRLCKGESVATWRVAVGATIGGLKHWCDRVDIETALMWVHENLHRMFQAPESVAN